MKVNGTFDTNNGEEELPPGLARWLTIESEITKTLDELDALQDDCHDSLEFVRDIHARVKAWLTWEFWASLCERRSYSPDALLATVVLRGVDVRPLRVGALDEGGEAHG